MEMSFIEHYHEVLDVLDQLFVHIFSELKRRLVDALLLPISLARTNLPAHACAHTHTHTHARAQRYQRRCNNLAAYALLRVLRLYHQPLQLKSSLPKTIPMVNLPIFRFSKEIALVNQQFEREPFQFLVPSLRLEWQDGIKLLQVRVRAHTHTRARSPAL